MPLILIALSVLLVIMYTHDLDFRSSNTSVLYFILGKKTEFLVYAVLSLFHVSLFALICPKLKARSKAITAVLLSLPLAVEAFFLNNYWMWLDVYAPWADGYYFKDFLQASVRHIYKSIWRYLALMGLFILLCAVWALLHTKKSKRFFRKKQGMVAEFTENIFGQANGDKPILFRPGTYAVNNDSVFDEGRYLFELDLTHGESSGTVAWYRDPKGDALQTYELNENSPCCCISLKSGDAVAVSSHTKVQRII